MSLFEDASLITTPNAYKAGKLYSIKPTNGDGDLDVVRATTATRVNSAGLIETVAANVPRLDYTGGGCPSILVEPQRTNLLTYSEQFDNAAWLKTFGEIVTADAATSPNGTMTADRIDVSANTLAGVIQIVTGGAGTYTFSVYAKRNLLSTGSTARIRLNHDSTNTQNEITLSDDWQRFTLTVSVSTSIEQIRFYNGSTDSVNNFDIWGAQLEEGSYPTSYIPTVASAVTRNADQVSKTGISDLIGQTEGTFYAEWTVTAIGVVSEISLSDGASQNAIRLRQVSGGALQMVVNNSGITQASISTPYGVEIGSNYKLAVGYAANDFVFYVNGEQIGTNNSGTPPTCSQFQTDRGSQDGASSLIGKLNQVLILKTRLLNSELETLTTL